MDKGLCAETPVLDSKWNYYTACWFLQLTTKFSVEDIDKEGGSITNYLRATNYTHYGLERNSNEVIHHYGVVGTLSVWTSLLEQDFMPSRDYSSSLDSVEQSIHSCGAMVAVSSQLMSTSSAPGDEVEQYKIGLDAVNMITGFKVSSKAVDITVFRKKSADSVPWVINVFGKLSSLKNWGLKRIKK